MYLKLYLVKNRITTSYFAYRLGCSRTHLSLIMSGKVKPGLTLAKLIEVLTNGEVTVDQMFEEYGKTKNLS